MKLRDVVIFTGKRFKVPPGIQRLDHQATHGWQLRYGGTKFFADQSQNGAGAEESLARATQELLKRIARLPAPNKLQDSPSASKTTDLPVGVFGPVTRVRKGSTVPDYSFSVLLPRFGESPQRRSIYIATENTYTREREAEALAKAIQLRLEAEKAYRSAATRAKRAQVHEMVAG
jgi:hypothetical protein